MINSQIVIPKTWRSETTMFVSFIVLSVIGIWLSHEFPGSVIKGHLLTLFGYKIMLKLPLLWFFPAGALGLALIRIYDVRYIIDSRGVECKTGILGLHQRLTRVRYEDIRSVETSQTLVQRILGIGSVEIATAATGETEILFGGIDAPLEVQEMIQSERDRRQKLARKQYQQFMDQVQANE